MDGTSFPSTSTLRAALHSRPRTTPEGEDLGLIRGLLADDPTAWGAFSVRYSRLMLSCISRVIARFGAVSPDDVREVYATLCVQLLSHDKKKIRSFEKERGVQLGSWLGLLATHAAYDFLRSVRRSRQFDELSRAESISADLPDPSEIALRSEQLRLLEGVLATFTEKDRAFVELYYAQGCDPEEIATQLGISVKTVYSKRHKLQARLQELLADERLVA